MGASCSGNAGCWQLTRTSVSLEDSYVYVQRNAMQVWNEGGQLHDRPKADKDITAKIPVP